MDEQKSVTASSQEGASWLLVEHNTATSAHVLEESPQNVKVHFIRLVIYSDEGAMWMEDDDRGREWWVVCGVRVARAGGRGHGAIRDVS
jgi:hypothetical protein